MKIPPKFDEILKRDQALDAMVKGIIADFEPILKDNKLFFFEEYTDHGIEHIEMVLEVSELLIPGDSFEFIRPKEIAILILATVLHDIGMHIDLSMFKAMIDGQYDDIRVDIFPNDRNTWRKLWDDYLSESRHWSSKQLEDIFGELVEIPEDIDLSNKDKLDGICKKIIGEFIRRNHARLAHEIALKGFIGDNIILFEKSKLDDIDRELIGIVTRSHGMKIRETFCYLMKIAQDAWKYPDGLNVIFLMALLRISDYLHIDKTRTNSILLKVKTLNSPISLREHKTHLSIRYIHFGLEEPELIYVACDIPTDAKMYVKIQTLLKNIQHELDLAWATLGEIYGFSSESKPNLKFRRIKSNLESLELDYVPKNIIFKMNNELSKLLVAPLYGNNPRYGVRELVQNATDACKERTKIERDRGNLNYDSFVKVLIDKINKEQYKFTIRDNGKGMTLDEILNYFLSIGSSFRQSYEWKKEFISEDGKELVKRNGKFGIGVLAAFLLGDEILVKTKSYKKDALAYIFKARLNSENIDVKKLSDFDIGTTVEILMSYDKYVELMHKKHNEVFWTDWYVNEKPHITYLSNENKIQSDKFINSYITQNFSAKDFCDVQWGYKKYKPSIGEWSRKKESFPNDMFVVCNDIIVTLSSKENKFKYTDNNQYIINSKPGLKIEDPNGKLPLKLDRNDLDSDADMSSFNNELLLEVSKDFIAQLLNLPFDSKAVEKHEIEPHNTDFLFLKNGFMLISDYFLNKIPEDFILLKIITRNKTIQDISSIFEKTDKAMLYSVFVKDFNPRHFNSGCCILLQKEKYQSNIECERPLLNHKNHEIEWENERYVVYSYKNYKRKSNVFDKETCLYIMNKIGEWVQSIQEVPLIALSKVKGGKILNELFEKYFGDNFVIPYNMEERKKLYKTAFEELEKYMKDVKRR